MRSKLLFAGMVLVGWAFAGCAAIQPVRPTKVEVQLRVSESVWVDPKTKLAFRRDHTIEGDLISRSDSSLTNGYRLFRKFFELETRDQSKALVIDLGHASTNQVFLLSIALKPKPTDWTNWRYPDYLETNAVSNLRFKYVPPDRTTNVPPDSFQLRYRIE